jgi:hypothetical protein
MRLKMKTSAFLLIGSAASACASGLQVLQERQANWTVGQTVQTNSGPVSGHPATNDSQVSEYLGIPFGKPPTGDLRFAAPVNFTGAAPLNGTNFVNFQTTNSQKSSNQLITGSLVPS